MGRVLAVLALVAIAIAVLLIVAPFLLVGALVIMVIAWRRPATLSRVTQHPRMSPVPSSVRSTPMRFAASLLVVTIGLTAASRVIAGPPDGGQPDESPAASTAAEPSADPTATPTPAPTATPRSTTTPSPRATVKPTPRPTPTPTPVPGTAPTGSTERGAVTNVVDGDTIDVVVDGVEIRVRYIGMDTPEVHSGIEWLGPEASAANATLVLGKEVVLEKDVSETDQYGRALRYVWVADGDGWLFVNLELIRLGLAVVTTYPPDVKYVDDVYLPAQADAREAGLGQWGAPPTPVPTPVPTAPPAPSSSCHASYVGYCVTAGIGDWDCAGGSGNGPNYLPVAVQVVGYDEFDLDRDGDGWGCE